MPVQCLSNISGYFTIFYWFFFLFCSLCCTKNIKVFIWRNVMYTKFYFLSGFFILKQFLLRNKNLSNLCNSELCNPLACHSIVCRLAQLFKISEGKIPSTKKSWNKNQRNNTEDKTESYKYTLSKCCNIEVGYPVLVFVAVLSRR